MHKMTDKLERTLDDLHKHMQNLGELRQRVGRLPNALQQNQWMRHGIVKDDALFPLHVVHAKTLVNKSGWIHMLAKDTRMLRVFSVMAADRGKYG